MPNYQNAEKKIYHIIYKTTCIHNGKYYIGAHSTDDIDDGYLGSGYLLKLAIQKYGKTSFTRKILHIFDNYESMYAKEKEIVNETFLSDPQVYNIVEGGFGGFNKGSTNLKHMSRGKDTIAVHKSKIDSFLADGWLLGGKDPINKGKVYVWKGDQRVAISEAEIEEFLENGWHRGYPTSPTKGKVWLYNTITGTYTKQNIRLLESYMQQGWIRKKKAPLPKGTTTWVHNVSTRKRIPKDDLQKYIEEGWNQGHNITNPRSVNS